MTKTLVIDPGHGGHDSGTSHFGLKEKDFALNVGLEVERYLLENFTGVRTLMTRRKDVYVKLEDRAKYANSNKADYFLSIHLNSATSTATGTETFLSKKAGSATLRYANNVHDQVYGVSKKYGLPNRYVKRMDFYVLRYTEAKACLTEILFLSNKRDADIIKKHWKEYAHAHAEGVAKEMGLQRKAVSKPEERVYQPAGKSHHDSWKWAYENGITDGYKPNDAVTRSQLTSMLKRYHDKFNK